MPEADTQTPERPASRRKDAVQVAGIGTGAGFFSGLIGVGGGTLIVPLLVLWRGLPEKRATGTSLLAIAVIAVFGAASYAVFGSVDVRKGALIGLPAIAGVIFGTWLQQRIPDRVLSGMFACLMFVVIVLYLVR